MTETAREVSWMSVKLSILLLVLATPALVSLAEAGNAEIVKDMTEAAVLLVFVFLAEYLLKYNTIVRENVQKIYEVIA